MRGFKKRRGKKKIERVGCHFARKSETYGLFPPPWHTEFINFTKSILKKFFLTKLDILVHIEVFLPLLKVRLNCKE